MATKIMTQEAGQVLANKIKQNTAAINANQSSITTIQAAMDNLNGTGDGSVDKKISDKIAEIVDGAPDSLDTLKEISDWISGHADDASAMNTAIQGNTTAITAAQSSITTLRAAVENLEANALTVDTALSDTSENPVQNKAVSSAITTINTAIANIQANAYDDSALDARVTALENQYEPVTASDVESWFTT